MFFVQCLRKARSTMVHKINGPPVGSPKFDILYVRRHIWQRTSGLSSGPLVSCKHLRLHSRKNAECKQP